MNAKQSILKLGFVQSDSEHTDVPVRELYMM